METLHPAHIPWLTFLLAAAAIHGLWLSILIFLKKRKEQRARLLSLTLVVVSLHLFNYLLFLTGSIRAVPHFLGVIFPLLFLIGPCFYFFCKTVPRTSFSF